MILLSNGQGSFALLRVPQSRYDGVFLRKDNRVFRVIESLDVPAECCWMPDNQNAFVVNLPNATETTLNLDCGELFDNRQWGRAYEVSQMHKCLVFSFSKFNDPRDGMGNPSEYQLHVAIFGDELEYLPIQKWTERMYSKDQQRNSWPWTRWVYQACKLRIKDAVFAFSTNKNEAVETAINMFAQRSKLKSQKAKRLALLAKGKSTEVANALLAIDALKTPDGLLAGLPWFSQVWARDELISLKSLILAKEFATVKKILWKHLANVDVTLQSKRDGAKSADAPGWLFFRIGEFLQALEKARVLKTFVTSKELAFVKQKLNAVLDSLFKTRFNEGVIVNLAGETWMDSESREGANIEIQALTLAVLKLNSKLSGKQDVRELQLKVAVRRDFLKNRTIIDGKGHSEIRPNLFLAAYLYPELFTKQEWTDGFDRALDALWLDWGGLATIDKASPSFTKDSTGENAKSYHHGDSWFWLNNLAAIAMKHLDAKHYAKYIHKITEAGMKSQKLDVINVSGELSSASHLSSQGSPVQLWSNATFVELCQTVFK